MIPNQKRSRSRSRMQRAAFRLRSVNFTDCPRCNKPKLPHAACDNCGYVRPGLSLKIEKEE